MADTKSPDDSPSSKFATVDGLEPTSTNLHGAPSHLPPQLGDYQVISELGSGGMGIVLKAYDPALKRFAALKIIRTEHPELAERFVQEARAQARVEHENVCKVYEVGEVNGKQYIAMQFIDGDTLALASRQMPVETKVRVMQQIAEALHAAHKHGLIHRDIKPSNIMLERSEEGEWKPYIMDFGLAREQDAPGLTRTGVALGTPHYMAPEQVSQEQLDRRTDVYGLGATLYELLSGEPPYQGGTGPDIMLKILQNDPVPLRKQVPKIPEDLETIVMKCLERNPARRYDSAKSLSEDLERYLNGDPVTAKPTSFSYRVIKRAKKNRLATGIALAGLVVTLILIGAFLWIQWQNKLKANYAREFGDEIKNIQSVLPSIYTAPLHDVRAELAQLRNHLKKMEERMKQGGSPAEDPGNNALGQGYLALGEIEKAREHLEKAWQAGFQSPSTAYSLGQTLGLIYQKKLAEAEQNSSSDVRKRLREIYEKEYRDPAVRYLKLAEGSVDSPAYVEGLIALYEKREDVALQKAREAFAKTPWFYDAKTLEAKALTAIAQKKSDAGDYKGAVQEFERAGVVFGQAAELGRSRAEIYLSDCDRWTKMIAAQTYTDSSPVPSLAKAEEVCKRAIQVNPDDASGYLGLSTVYKRVGRIVLYGGTEDARLYYQKATDQAKEILRKHPGSWEAYQSLGSTGNLKAEYELRHGIDPRKTLEEARHHTERSLKIRPENTGALIDLGMTYSHLGEYEGQTGKNPIPTYEKGLEQFRKAEKIDPAMTIAIFQSGILYWHIASYQQGRGEDGLNSLQQSIDAYEKFLKSAPDDPYALYNLALVYVSKADYEQLVEKDPSRNYQKGIELALKAEKFIPNNPYVVNSIGNTYGIWGIYLVGQQKDPSAQFERARKFLGEATQLDPNYYQPHSNLGNVELSTSQWLIQQGKSPGDSFGAARKFYLRSIECNKEEPRGYQTMAETYRLEADWLMAQKRAADTQIGDGLQWIAKSLKMNEQDPASIATKGALLLLQARSNRDPEERKRIAAEAAATLEKAIRMNSFLRKEYEPLLNEAKTKF